MNEVHFGAGPLPHSFSALLNHKVKDLRVMRKLVLEGHRFTPSELLGAGLIDEIVDGGSEAVLARACEIAEQWSGNARASAWGLIRDGLHRAVLEGASLDGGVPSKSRLWNSCNLCWLVFMMNRGVDAKKGIKITRFPLISLIPSIIVWLLGLPWSAMLPVKPDDSIPMAHWNWLYIRVLRLPIVLNCSLKVMNKQ